ncbi:MAG: RNA polymerase sigma factor [candidate division KSB1 bacterium]|nr:RNA polymerase sigma factor [candidate division KSB1 bacterium]MDZ7274574.1 RNA polymerase sigma factor [candidate division KSB1 bacterium]MDZ7284765.1 RNA polymerase sigma factor [candidate division KSB1 bacterium]MDZ7297815.1 RNA polymerase sigma factor [candidate division KSB1 bacterium]MDZ7307779.1 RNA polymerase sigma factor [candidate division KSB1 bacterium]
MRNIKKPVTPHPPVHPAAEPADKAIPRLLETHGGLIYNLGLRMCGRPTDAEDLVQETFLRAFRKWEQFEGRSEPATWLYTIAVRACQRLKRRRAGQPQRMQSLAELLPDPEADEIPDLPADHDGPLDQVLRREAQEAVQRALTKLPPPFRMALLLKDIVEFSVEEVARVLGIKEATVKTRVHRGRLLLRKELAKKLPKHKAPPPDHEKQVCLHLLHAKQEALDRGVEFPLAAGELCSRCQSLFATLDLTHEICLNLKRGPLPEPLRHLLLQEFKHAGRAGGRRSARRSA